MNVKALRADILRAAEYIEQENYIDAIELLEEVILELDHALEQDEFNEEE